MYFCDVKELRSLNPYLYKYRKLLLLGVLFIVLSNFFTIFGINYFRDALNTLNKATTNSQSFNKLLIYSGLFIGFNVISGVFKYYQRQTVIVASRYIEFELREKIYKHYQRLDTTFYKNNKVGDLMNRISEDVGNVRMYLGPGIMYFVNLVSLFVIILVMMLSYDVTLTCYALLPLPILSIVIYLISDKINKKSKVVQQSQSEISSYVQDTFSGIRVIKSFNKEDYIAENYREKALNYKAKTLSLVNTEASFFTMMIFFIGISNIFIVYVGGMRYFEGKVDIGVLGSFFLFINQLIWPFTSLGWVTSLVQRAEASMTRVNEFMRTPKENLQEQNPTHDFKGTIEFRNVNFTYENTGIQALRNVSFTIEAKQTVAIMGNTGSGKTTIALMIGGFIQPNSGDIYIDGIPMKDLNLKNLRDSIGFVPQDSFLFSDSIYNNIAFGLDSHSQRDVELYAEKANIHDSITGFTNQYETIIGERGVTLSGGQKQRVAIARALAKKSSILIFDDSLSALDTDTEEAILQNIGKDFHSKTNIIITHRISASKNVDKIIVLEEGTLVEEGSPNDLLQKEGYYSSIYDLQINE